MREQMAVKPGSMRTGGGEKQYLQKGGDRTDKGADTGECDDQIL